MAAEGSAEIQETNEAGGAKSKARPEKEDLYRQLALGAAQSLLADKGYDAAKIGEIAELSGVFVARDPSLIARMVVSMQQVELAHWLESRMERDPEHVAHDLEEQVTRAFRVTNSPGSTS
jgi:hypothetical protein